MMHCQCMFTIEKTGKGVTILLVSCAVETADEHHRDPFLERSPNTFTPE